MSSSQKGVIYILSNSAMPNSYKIGKTSEGHLRERMRELYSTGVPVPFQCEYAVLLENYNEVEKALHIAFAPERINDNREFFETTPDRIIAILKLLNGREITGEVTCDIESDISQSDKNARNRIKRPKFDFHSMGIPDGETITFVSHEEEQTPDNTSPITAIVEGKKVKYHGELLSLTLLTQRLLQIDYSVQPTPYWMYRGKKLIDIYNETYETASQGNTNQDNLL